MDTSHTTYPNGDILRIRYPLVTGNAKVIVTLRGIQYDKMLREGDNHQPLNYYCRWYGGIWRKWLCITCRLICTTHTHTSTHIHTQIHTLHTQIHTLHTYKHTQIHIYTTHRYIHTHTHTHTHTNTHTCIHTHTHAHMHTHKHTHTRMHAHAHTHVHTY